MRLQLYKQIDKESGHLKKELKNAVILLKNGKKLLKDGHKLFCILLPLIEDIMQVLKMPVTQQRLHLPEKLRALQKALINNGLREKYADLISAIGVEKAKDENILNEEVMQYAPNVEKMQRFMKNKLAIQLDQNDQRLQQRFQAFNDTEADLRNRLRQLEAQN